MPGVEHHIIALTVFDRSGPGYEYGSVDADKTLKGLIATFRVKNEKTTAEAMSRMLHIAIFTQNKELEIYWYEGTSPTDDYVKNATHFFTVEGYNVKNYVTQHTIMQEDK